MLLGCRYPASVCRNEGGLYVLSQADILLHSRHVRSTVKTKFHW